MVFPDRRLISNFIAYTALMVPIAAIDIGALVLLIQLGVHYLLANVIGFLIANLLIYLLSRRLIFKQPGAGSLAEFTIFGLIGLVAIVIQEIVLWVVVSQFHLHYLIGKIGAMGITVFWTYFARRHLVHSNITSGSTPVGPTIPHARVEP